MEGIRKEGNKKFVCLERKRDGGREKKGEGSGRAPLEGKVS